MKKILSLLGSIGLTATAAATVVACGGNSEVNSQKTKFDELIALNEADTTKKLTEVDTWLAEEANSADVTKINEVITANEVALPEGMTQVRLDEVLEKQLEKYTLAIKTSTTVSSIEEQKTQVEKYAKADLKLSINADQKAWIAKIIKYADTRINELKDIKNLLKVTALGEITIANPNPTDKEILNAVKAKNETIDIDQLEVKDIKATQATISVKEDSKDYNQSSVEVTYTVKRAGAEA